MTYRPLMVQVLASGDPGRPIRVMLDVGDEGDAQAYDLDRDQARFLVHQLQVEPAETSRLPPAGRFSNSGG
ncbi:hypothetical protein B4N89_29365 [Embleya scabrispora]|uniref:Uncharacterized protein n=1 Tax=Embleya scabrispora TaxID=159449 RepID=A0A1T3P5W2_9ACTN|nr:hypothetical protein [Embleya scabrispora]OPC84489.1 hypothetical protein B4N89_29365 [Embleya scabrispora]